MDAEGLKRDRDVRAQKRVLLVDKWQVRIAQALGKRRGSHQIGVVVGKPRVEMKGEDSDRKPEGRKKG